MLRLYQKDILKKLNDSASNALVQLDTGGGKSHIIAHYARDKDKVIIFAHRIILINQLHKTLSDMKINHALICSDTTLRQCAIKDKRFIQDNSNVIIASIDTFLVRKNKNLDDFVVIYDEAHHVLKKNKWGKSITGFNIKRVVGFTATPCRADGCSLDKDGAGLFDEIIQAGELKQNSVRTLINKGFLSDFICYASQQTINEAFLKISKSGDFEKMSLIAETKRNHVYMASNAIKEYKRLAEGKQALVFCPCVELAKDIARQFKDSGISSACISSKDSSKRNQKIISMYLERHINVLTHVNMFDEGVDISGIECVIMMRKTLSLSAYRQWCGRALRPELNKKAIIIDLVGNCLEHGLPDRHIEWSLENTSQQIKSNLLRCKACNHLNPAHLIKCEQCGYVDRRDVNAMDCQELRYLDLNIIEIRKKAISDLNQTEELRPYPRLDVPPFLSAINKIRDEYIKHVSEVFGIKEANQVIQMQVFSSFDFWVDKFNAKDIGNKKKYEKVYKQCMTTK